MEASIYLVGLVSNHYDVSEYISVDLWSDVLENLDLPKALGIYGAKVSHYALTREDWLIEGSGADDLKAWYPVWGCLNELTEESGQEHFGTYFNPTLSSVRNDVGRTKLSWHLQALDRIIFQLFHELPVLIGQIFLL